MGSLDEIKAMKAELQKKIEDEGKAILRKEFAAFFEAHPEIKAVRWEQYTPYFNDGEPCEFGVNSFDFKPADKDKAKDSESGDGFLSEYDVEDDDPMAKAVSELQSRVSDDDVFEAVFGDHVRVTANRRGFDVEEYDHD